MKKFLAFYIVLFVAGTFAIDKYFPAFASDAPPAAPENEAPVVVAGEANPPAAEPVKQAEPAPAPAFDTRRLPPLPENLQSSGNFKSWGLAKTNLSPEIPGGTFLEYPDKDATPLLAWWFANKKWNGPLEVPPEKVTFFGGSLDDAEPGQLRIFQRYYSLRGQLENPPVEAPPADTNNGPVNPHLEDYKAVAKEVLEFQERTKTLTAKRDAAKGAERVKLVNELTVMKQNEPDLLRRYKAVETKYNDWKAKNPAPKAPEPAPKAPDPERVKKIQEEMQILKAEMEKILK